MEHKLILASTSPYRKRQLEDLDIPFKVATPEFNEDDYKKANPSIDIHQLSQVLAYEKAKSLKDKFPNDFILGCDQLVVFQNEAIGKAGNLEKACQQLLKFSGQPHSLLTSISLLTPNKVYNHTDTTTLYMRKLTKEEILKYVTKHETWTCAGSYKFECQPALLFEKIESQDPTSIIGIPTLKLITWLKISGWI